MTMRLGDVETKHPLMECPACGGAIEADVTVQVKAHFGGLSEDLRHVEVKADPTISRFVVQHRCMGRVETVDEVALG